jgi:16S rRNA (uracil1498-N3)-methyltransferase
MRAVLIESDFSAGAMLELSEEQAHHLGVVRARTGDQILVINGKGEKADATIVTLTKKSGQIQIQSITKDSRKHQISIALGVPKKDAFEDIVKMAVELGVVEIHPLSSQFSQYEVEPSERLNRLIESAMIQSNNLFWPAFYKQTTLDKFLENFDGNLIYFSSRPTSSEFKLESPFTSQTIVLIGPEGGFSEAEEAKIMAYKKAKIVHLPTPIMRAPTAVATSIGYLLSES